MKKTNLLIFGLMSLFLRGSCTPQEPETTKFPDDAKTGSTVISFGIMFSDYGDGGQYFYISDFNGADLGYLYSKEVESFPLTFGDYVEYVYTGYIFSEPTLPPSTYIRDGKLLSKKKIEHKTEQYQYKIIDGVGTFVSPDSTYTYSKQEFYLTYGNRAYPFSMLNDGDYLTAYYSPVEDKYDDQGKVIHNIACFFRK